MYAKNFKDITGQQFGLLTAIRVVGKDKNGHCVWLCVCSCPAKTKVEVSGDLLRMGKKGNCGCRFKDLIGKRFGRLTVIELAQAQSPYVWLCQCNCRARTKVEVSGRRLRNKQGAKNCGCIRREAGVARRKHGHAGSRNRRPSKEYKAYEAAKARCNNPNTSKYPCYGDRGIKCLFTSFPQCLAEIGLKSKPYSKYSLHRLNNDGDYVVNNIVWGTQEMQMSNRRPLKRILKKKPARETEKVYAAVAGK